MVNGAWIGVHTRPRELCDKLKACRRSGLIPMYTSVQWDISAQCILFIPTQVECVGQFYVNNGRASFDKPEIREILNLVNIHGIN